MKRITTIEVKEATSTSLQSHTAAANGNGGNQDNNSASSVTGVCATVTSVPTKDNHEPETTTTQTVNLVETVSRNAVIQKDVTYTGIGGGENVKNVQNKHVCSSTAYQTTTYHGSPLH